jgi:putative two-component system response regulator
MPYSPPNILVVDDVNANLAVLTEILHNAGYIARPVTSARQAVSAIEALTPNLILLDISMPEIDGFVFCSMLKKNAKTRGIPIVFISAMNSPEDKIRGFEAGAVDYIIKPFESEELVLRIGTHLKMYKMQQELVIYNKKLNKIINDQIGKIYEEQKNLIYALAVLSVKGNSLRMQHLEHISKNSRLLAMSLQLSPKYKNQITNSFIDAIEITSQLYDIGRCGELPGQTYASGVEEESWEYTISGAKILEEIYSKNRNNELLKMAIDISKYHREHWDGSGHPQGLKETGIPLTARIVSVVDRYDSLISNNQKNKNNTHDDEIRMINELAGIYYDPDIVVIFNKIHQQLVK